jgi:hypothetical protein
MKIRTAVRTTNQAPMSQLAGLGMSSPALASLAALLLVACGGAWDPQGRPQAGQAGQGGSVGRSGSYQGGEAGQASQGPASAEQWYCSEGGGTCQCHLEAHPGSLHPCQRSYRCCVQSADGRSCDCSGDSVCQPKQGIRVERCPAFLGEG